MTTRPMLAMSPTGHHFVSSVEGGGFTTRYENENKAIKHDAQRILRGLSPDKFSFFVMSMLPRDVDIMSMDDLDATLNFIQTAGTPETFTVEHAHPEDDAVWHEPDLDNIRDILGHAAPDTNVEPSVRIPMTGGRFQTVYPEEVFTTTEVADIFTHYYRHGTPPPELHQRRVPL